MTEDPPKYSILGLGDIVIPGVFVSLCLRFDFMKNVSMESIKIMANKEKNGERHLFVNYLVKIANISNKYYFITVLIGYVLAILTTVLIMILFDHG